MNVQAETCRNAKNIKFFVVSTVLFTTLRPLHFDKQWNVHSFTTVYNCINYRPVDVLTLDIHSQQSFLQSRLKCNIFKTYNLKV